ncbi:MAG: amino acid ABC transporter substrate-binding protein [Gammaproteobacteria bacterium]|nr:amino acid ABC transporter substrate-binding protein [Gammaproteobacteria bacterium]
MVEAVLRLGRGMALCALAVLSAGIAAADTLSDVLERGKLRCAVIEASPGFSSIDANGRRYGFDIDNCKTVAAAVLGDADAIEYVPINPNTAFTTLQSGGVDVFPGGATWTFLRDTSLGLDYTGTYLYAGQGFVVRRASGVSSIPDLEGATICVAQGTTNEQNLADYFRARRMKYSIVTFADVERGLNAYLADRCDAFTTEVFSLAGRIVALRNPEEHRILGDVISKEPFSGLVRQGDPRWRDIVFWAFNSRVAAEEFGLTMSNVEEMRATTEDAEIRRFLGVEGGFGRQLGLRDDWAYQIVAQVGNYGEVFARHFEPLGLERGLNALWRDGGLMIAMPYR